jgi:hypothetical protein
MTEYQIGNGQIERRLQLCDDGTLATLGLQTVAGNAWAGAVPSPEYLLHVTDPATGETRTLSSLQTHAQISVERVTPGSPRLKVVMLRADVAIEVAIDYECPEGHAVARHGGKVTNVGDRPLNPARDGPSLSSSPNIQRPTPNAQHPTSNAGVPYPLHWPAARRDAAALPRAKRLSISRVDRRLTEGPSRMALS